MKSICIAIAILTMSSMVSAEEFSAESRTGPSATLRTGKHLFILSGQSNMYHMKAEDTFIPAVVKAFGKGNVTVAKSNKRGAPIRSWDKDYKWPEDRGIPQGKKRAGKKKVDRKTYEAGFGVLYDKLLQAVQKRTAGKTYDTVTFLWMQGETDAGQNLVHLYADSFDRVVARLKSDLKIKSMNIVIGRLSDCGKSEAWIKMRQLQMKYAEDNPHVEWINTDDLNDKKLEDGTIKNDLHYTKEGYKLLGQRYAEKAIALIEK